MRIHDRRRYYRDHATRPGSIPVAVIALLIAAIAAAAFIAVTTAAESVEIVACQMKTGQSKHVCAAQLKQEQITALGKVAKWW